MRNQPIPLVSGFYRDEARPFSQQDVCNYLPTKAESAGTRSPLMLKTPPGLYPYAEIEGAPPVRGIHDCEGKLLAVIGTTLYRLSNSAVAIPIGNIPGNGRVSMDHNQIANGNQLMVANGSAGYVYNTVTDTLAKVTDPGFPGTRIARFLDSYMLGIDPAGRFAFNSAPADATDYNTLDRWTSEYKPDQLVSMGRSGGELLLLSVSSGEFFQNTGAAQQPFRSKRITIDKGCAGPHTVVEADNTIFWLGSDGYFYQLDGYSARRISTRPIEQSIRGQDWWNAFGFLWESEGHTCVFWTFLNGLTWCWDTAQQEWSRRQSYGLNRWRVNGTARSNGKWYAGDFQNGRIWRIDWNYPWEGDAEFVSSFTQPVIHDNQNDLVHNRLELVLDVGQPEVEPAPFPGQPSGPSISGSAPDGYYGMAYPGYSYTVTPGDAPIQSIKIVSGGLPDGLSFSAGTIDTEVSTDAGTSTFTIRVTDTNGLWAELTDSIEIVLPRWDPLHTGAGGALENDTRTFVTNITATQRPLTRSFIGATLTDKFYCEIVIDNLPSPPSGDPIISIGIVNQDHAVSNMPYVGRDQGSGGARGIGVLPGHTTGQNVNISGCGGATSGMVYGADFAEGDVMMLAFDGPNARIWLGRNGVWDHWRTNGVYGPCESVVADPAAGSDSISQISSWNTGTSFYVAMTGRDNGSDHVRGTLRILEVEFDYDIPAGFAALGELA